MPFVSKAQWRKCYAMQSEGSDWDCDEFAEMSPDYDDLPEYVANGELGREKIVQIEFAVLKDDGTWRMHEGWFNHYEGASLFDELHQWWVRDGRRKHGGVGVTLISVDWNTPLR